MTVKNFMTVIPERTLAMSNTETNGADVEVTADELRSRAIKECGDWIDRVTPCLEELKDELSMIIITQTTTGRDKWDTPDVKLPGGRKSRLRKDRYSSLIMANMSARKILRTPPPHVYDTIGGFAGGARGKIDGPEYVGPAWFTEGMRDVY